MSGRSSATSTGARPTRAVVRLASIEANYRKIRELLPREAAVMAVVKANAYGHGDVEVSRLLEGLGCEYLGVALVEEGVRLRKAGMTSRIVVLGGAYPGQVDDLFRYGLTPVVFDLDSCVSMDAAARKAGTRLRVHVKVDTGMSRLGVPADEAEGFFRSLGGMEGLEVEGLMTHFSESEKSDKTFTMGQLDSFLSVLETARALGFDPPLLDISNSAAAVEMPEARLTLVRPGIMLYGSYPSERMRDIIDLEPALELRTRVTQVREVPAGTPVSYGRAFVTERPSRIATLPIGYGDGLPRALSGRGEVVIRGRRAPVAGTVCMDFTMVDVTDIEGAGAGDEVVIIGSDGGETITAEEVAERAGTIGYEILTGISSRVPRVYV